MQRIVNLEWIDWNEDETFCGVWFEDVTGKRLELPYHNPAKFKQENQVDSILMNYLLRRIFKENGIDCLYLYPITLTSVTGLVNDARKLFRMKEQGEMDKFRFHYCLDDVRKGEMIDLAIPIYNDCFGCGDDLEMLVYMIKHA